MQPENSVNSVEGAIFDWLRVLVAPESIMQSTACGLARHLDPPSAIDGNIV